MALEKCTWTLASLVDPSVTGGGVDGTLSEKELEAREDERATMPWPLTAAPVPLEAFKLVAREDVHSLTPPTQSKPAFTHPFQSRLSPPMSDRPQMCTRYYMITQSKAPLTHQCPTGRPAYTSVAPQVGRDEANEWTNEWRRVDQ